MSKYTVKILFDEMQNELQKGDEIISETTSSGKIIKYSKVVGEYRIKSLDIARNAMKLGDWTAEQATRFINEFGKKTTKLYWIKN